MQSPSPGMAAYQDLLREYEHLRPHLEILDTMLDEMFQKRVAEKKHGEFHDKSPLRKYACGNWYSVSALRLLFPFFGCKEGISGLDTGGKYLEAFVEWLPEKREDGFILAESIMKCQKALCTFLSRCQYAGLRVWQMPVLTHWHELSNFAEEIAKIDDAQYRHFCQDSAPEPTEIHFELVD